MSELDEELEKLRIVMVRRLRERLEDPAETATPAYLDVARKMISDLMATPPAPPPRPAVSLELPFKEGDDE